MTLPDDLGVATLVGTFLDTQGAPDPGWLRLTPNTPWLRQASPARALDSRSSVYPVNLDADLEPLSEALPLSILALATNNAGVSPSGWNWRGDLMLRHRQETFYFFALAGQTVDLATVVSTVPAEGRDTPVLTVGGVAPGPDGNVPIDSIPGTPGPQGPQGPAGATGATGATGAAGPQGSTGATGAAGAAGAQGPAGADGSDGSDGVQGPQGIQGPAGADGDDGTNGAPGAAGATGATGSTGPAGRDGTDVASRYGCISLSMDPHDLGASDPRFIAMFSQRLYQVRVPVPVGVTISSVKVPIKDIGVGAGALRFAVYQEDLSQLGVSADVAAAFTTGAGETWRTVALTAPDETTGDYVWIVALSTLDTGPQLAFCEVGNVGDFPWLLNPAGQLNIVYTPDVAALPGTLAPGSGTPYLDVLVGVA